MDFNYSFVHRIYLRCLKETGFLIHHEEEYFSSLLHPNDSLDLVPYLVSMPSNPVQDKSDTEKSEMSYKIVNLNLQTKT